MMYIHDASNNKLDLGKEKKSIQDLCLPEKVGRV